MFETIYGPIVGQRGKFLDNEPFFLLRAKDKLAPHALRRYAEVCCFLGVTTKNKRLLEIGHYTKMVALEMEDWQRQNVEKVELPD